MASKTDFKHWRTGLVNRLVNLYEDIAQQEALKYSLIQEVSKSLRQFAADSEAQRGFLDHGSTTQKPQAESPSPMEGVREDFKTSVDSKSEEIIDNVYQENPLLYSSARFYASKSEAKDSQKESTSIEVVFSDPLSQVNHHQTPLSTEHMVGISKVDLRTVPFITPPFHGSSLSNITSRIAALGFDKHTKSSNDHRKEVQPQRHTVPEKMKDTPPTQIGPLKGIPKMRKPIQPKSRGSPPSPLYPAIPIIKVRDHDDEASRSREVSFASVSGRLEIYLETFSAGTQPKPMDMESAAQPKSYRYMQADDKDDTDPASEAAPMLSGSNGTFQPDLQAFISSSHQIALANLFEDTKSIADATRTFISKLSELRIEDALFRQSNSSGVPFSCPSRESQCSDQTKRQQGCQALQEQANAELVKMKHLIESKRLPRLRALRTLDQGPMGTLLAPDWMDLSKEEKAKALWELRDRNGTLPIKRIEELLLALLEEKCHWEFMTSLKVWDEGLEKLEREVEGLFSVPSPRKGDGI